MFLLGLSLAVLLVVASIALGGWGKLVVFWDTPSASWVLLGVLLHIYIWGRPYFVPGLKAIFRRPKTGDPAVADYFRRLTLWTVGVGVAGMALGNVWAFLWQKQVDRIGAPIALSVLTFFYAACLAMMIFAPVSVRFSIDETETRHNRRFPVLLTLLGLAAYFLTRAGMVILLYSINRHTEARDAGISVESLPIDAEDVGFVFSQTVFSLNPGDFYSSFYHYLHPQMYWDTPSLVLIAGLLWAFRLSAGKPKNRLDWIPIAIIYGILGSITGMVLMLSDLDPDKYAPGCMVALLTAFYGLIAAVFFAIGSWRLFWIFILTFPVAMFTWALPHVFLVPFTEKEIRAPIWMYGVYFSAYGACLYFYLRNIIGGVRAMEQWFRKPPENTEPMSSDEEEAQKILESAVEKQKQVDRVD